MITVSFQEVEWRVEQAAGAGAGWRRQVQVE